MLVESVDIILSLLHNFTSSASINYVQYKCCIKIIKILNGLRK